MHMHLICSMTGSFRQSPLLNDAFDIKPLRMIHPSIGKVRMDVGSNYFNSWYLWAVTIKTACRPPYPSFSSMTPEMKVAICFFERDNACRRES